MIVVAKKAIAVNQDSFNGLGSGLIFDFIFVDLKNPGVTPYIGH